MRTVTAPAERVWELVSEPFHLPRWWPSAARVEDVEAGAWTTVLTTSRGATVRADFTRTELVPERRVAWRQELEESPFERVFVSAETFVELEADGGDNTRVSLRVVERLRGRYRLGGWLVRRAARRRLDAALEGIAEAVE